MVEAGGKWSAYYSASSFGVEVQCNDVSSCVLYRTNNECAHATKNLGKGGAILAAANGVNSLPLQLAVMRRQTQHTARRFGDGTTRYKTRGTFPRGRWAANNRHATPIRCGDRQVTHSGVGSPGCFSCSHGCAAASRRGLPCSARSCSWAQSAWAPFARASWSLPFAAPSRMGARSRRGRR